MEGVKVEAWARVYRGEEGNTHTAPFVPARLSRVELYTSLDSQTATLLISSHILHIDLQQLLSSIQLFLCEKMLFEMLGHLISGWDSTQASVSSQLRPDLCLLAFFTLGDNWKLEDGTVCRLLSLAASVPPYTIWAFGKTYQVWQWWRYYNIGRCTYVEYQPQSVKVMERDHSVVKVWEYFVFQSSKCAWKKG